MVHADPVKSRQVMEFKIPFFQVWKVMESGVGPGKSWKINQMVWTHVLVFGIYNTLQDILIL